ncbi:hypothetical protein L914_08026, partial [Phytophthora nicotianae]
MKAVSQHYTSNAFAPTIMNGYEQMLTQKSQHPLCDGVTLLLPLRRQASKSLQTLSERQFTCPWSEEMKYSVKDMQWLAPRASSTMYQ